MLVWLGSKDAQKGKNRPKPLSPLAQRRGRPGRQWGATDRPAEEVAQLLLDVADGKWSTGNGADDQPLAP